MPSKHLTIIFKDLSGFICATFCLELKIVISKTFERKIALEELVGQVFLIKIAVNLECRCRGNFDIKPIYSFLVAVNFDQVYIFFQNQVYISFSIMNSVEESLVH